MVVHPARPQIHLPPNAPRLSLFEAHMMKSLALETDCHRAERPAQPQARGFHRLTSVGVGWERLLSVSLEKQSMFVHRVSWMGSVPYRAPVPG